LEEIDKLMDEIHHDMLTDIHNLFAISKYIMYQTALARPNRGYAPDQNTVVAPSLGSTLVNARKKYTSK
jgi:hypothetical protein